ncbi:class F sortase [Planococcus lenghuensis]|uniref:Class F sortase n=1 Tax=Planococcus lenghuensis TaxID=2213202 RepID=A0A1Q2L2D1_9BACL|nr:class F sortase [Planococcus lenghuensis]AQQ54566.1 hypothetical protein B0X71_16625 [Planococcus lenghuensis]
MRGIVKKGFLIYFLFLLTTINDNPGFATEPISAENGTGVVTERIVANKPAKQPALPEAEETVQEIRTEVPGKPAVEPAVSSAETDAELIGITPALIEIPAIGESAEVIEVGVTSEGAMEAPANIYQIGWYAPGAMPGSAGNAVMAGHVDGMTSPGTFYNLKKLKPGDEIHITGTEGQALTFIVTETAAYAPEEAPLEKIFGASPESHLNLITCTGPFNEATGHYEERLVVYADLLKQ